MKAGNVFKRYCLIGLLVVSLGGNAQNNPQEINTTWRAFANIRQKFGTANSNGDKEKSQSVISNAYFTFLASYEKSKRKVQDDSHKDKIFDYGYIGKFNLTVDTGISNYNNVFAGTDSSYWIYTGRSLSPVTFERSENKSTYHSCYKCCCGNPKKPGIKNDGIIAINITWNGFLGINKKIFVAKYIRCRKPGAC